MLGGGAAPKQRRRDALRLSETSGVAALARGDAHAAQRPLVARDAHPPYPGFGDVLRRQWSASRCEGHGRIELTESAIQPEDVALVVPLGLMVDSHVTPIDHA